MRRCGFFGGTSAADRRAALSFARVQERLGVDAVLGVAALDRSPAQPAQANAAELGVEHAHGEIGTPERQPRRDEALAELAEEGVGVDDPSTLAQDPLDRVQPTGSTGGVRAGEGGG